jgi:hypothetical protein
MHGNTAHLALCVRNVASHGVPECLGQAKVNHVYYGAVDVSEDAVLVKEDDSKE